MKITSAAKLTNLKWLNMFDVAYTDKEGRSRSWQMASRSKEPRCVTGNYMQPDAVVVVPYHTTERKLVVIKEFRVSLADYQYGFPAGLVDAGDTVEQTARRELLEETGLVLTRFLKVSGPLYSSAGMTDESVVMVYAECSGQPSTARNTGSEMIEVQFFTQTQASHMCRNPALKFDVKAWLALVSFADKGNIE